MTYVELESVSILRETDAALLVELDDGDERWIPKSVIEDNGEDFTEGYEGRMYVAEWFSEKEGLE